jgi:two-component system, chemotaxis family, CheB/CheR fusion protein
MDQPIQAPAPAPAHLEVPVIGIGASAGGIKALLQFFENMPRATGMAFVVILHLSPKHESSLDKVLRGVTKMPVSQVTEAVSIERDHVYVISPASDLAMLDGTLQVRATSRRNGRHTAIDLFFRTLAQAKKTRAICIVLSGTGSDGTVGTRSIREEGGIAIAQEPEEAEYAEMPRNAIAAGAVDFVLPVLEMPQKLLNLMETARLIVLPHADELPAELDSARRADTALRDVLALLRTRTGHDFAQYKRATVLRRVERRMQVNQVVDLPAYRDFLRDNMAETPALLRDMLISVTNFFRDREAFEALERIVIPALFEGKSGDDQIRVWVPGCATGEEAYSIAMLLAERAQEVESPPGLQIFATDIDEDALAVGRAGLYPEAIITDVPPARLRRFFVKETGAYSVQKFIREMVTFAPHNVIRDAPFSRLDLVCCRNLLIYLNREVQGRALDIFHFALRRDGYLFLGTSESIDEARDSFAVVDKSHRLFRTQLRARARPMSPLLLSSLSAPRTPLPARVSGDEHGDSFGELHHSLLESYGPPSAVFDDQYRIVHLSENAGQFLQFTAGEPSMHLLHAVHPDLRLDLRMALYQAMQTMHRVEVGRVALHRPGGTSHVHLTVHPVRDVPTSRTFSLVLFDERQPSLEAPTVDSAAEPTVKAGSSALERELSSMREQLRATVEQYETQNEELKASNEELQAINEELRSATEELETSKEELQSINEELATVNQELKSKVDETATVNNDLQNFIASTNISVLFVNRQLKLVRFTPPARELFNVIPSDIGRPLLDITNRLEYSDLERDVGNVFETLRTVEREVRGVAGHWYLMRILPYRTSEDHIEGAVLTFVDISSRKETEERLRRSQQRYRATLESIRDYAILTVDLSGRIDGWNEGAAEIFGYDEAEIVGHPVDILFVPEDRASKAPEREMNTAREQGHAADERWHLRKDGSRFFCSGVMAPLSDGEIYGFVKVARDLTQQQQATVEREQQFIRAEADRVELENVNRLKDRFLATLSHELRNPLNLIMMQSELLRRSPEVKAQPSLSRATDIIYQTVTTQARLVDDLLDVSRINTGKLAVEQQLLPLPFVVGDSIGALQRDVEQKRLLLDLALSSEPLIVQGDPVRVKQVAWNLISNAIKFTPPGGRITVRVARDGNEARIDVEDNGQGISPEFMPYVFELFRQNDPGLTRRHGGMGIGLALVRQLVDLQGGRVEAHSDGEGKGARFTVWLPLYFAPEARAGQVTLAPAMPAPAGSAAGDASRGEAQDGSRRLEGLRVLVVDDDISSAQALRDLLDAEGADVEAANSGAAALQLAERRDFDVVISDIAMPQMDGHTLLAALRENPRTAHVPAIACTGYGSAADLGHARRSGFVTHLVKPLEMERVITAIREAIAVGGGR